MEDKIIKRNLSNSLTKMNALILKELTKGRNYKQIYDTLIESGYQVKNEESVRFIIRKIKTKYNVKTLFQLGFYYGIDIYYLDAFKELQLALNESVDQRIKGIEQQRKLSSELSQKYIEINNMKEELEELTEEWNVKISKRYAAGRIEGRMEQKHKTGMYMFISFILVILLIITSVLYFITCPGY